MSDSIIDALSTNSENTKKIDKIKLDLENIDNKVSSLYNCINEQISKLESIIEFTCELKK